MTDETFLYLENESVFPGGDYVPNGRKVIPFNGPRQKHQAGWRGGGGGGGHKGWNV